MLLSLSKHSKTTVALEILDDEGAPHTQRLLNRYQQTDISLLAALMPEATRAEVIAVLNGVCDNEESQVVECTLDESLIESTLNPKLVPVTVEPVQEKPKFVLHVRGINNLKSTAIAYSHERAEDALREAMEDTFDFDEPVIEWTDSNALACLDIDYHDVTDEMKPTPEQLRDNLLRVRPVPLCYHPSHGGGMKLYYLASPGFTAEELASLAGVSWVTGDERATFDLIKTTRHPHYPRLRDNKPAPVEPVNGIRWTHGTSDVSFIREALAQKVTANQVEEILAERGHKLGDILPHTECPIQPTNDVKANVFVGEFGYYCHRCKAKGYGGSTPGFYAYSRMLNGYSNRVANCVRNFTHWEHARVVLENTYNGVPLQSLKHIYRCMLKAYHGFEDERIDMALCAGAGFLRTAGMWVTADGRESLTDNKAGYVGSLPAIKYFDSIKDKYVADTSKLTAFMNSGSLSAHGYDDVSFIRGCRVFGVHMRYRDNEIVRVVPRPEFADAIPTYVPRAKRMDIEQAWQLLDSEYPGINRNYVKLLIAAKGASEGRLAQCPFLLVTGVSSAGKSTTVHIAAGICGDKAEEPIFQPFVDRFRQSLMDASRNSGFVCVNEVFKMAERVKLSYTQALDPMLSLTEDSRSHVLYIGSVPFGRLPVFVLTDIAVPAEVEQDVQLSRRFTFFRLPVANNWQKNIALSGRKPHEFRLISWEHNAAADAILSDVIDTYFQEPTPLYEIASQLVDNGTPDESTGTGERERVENMMSEFFRLVCDAPPLTGSHKNRYTGFGWKLIDRATDSPLVKLWDEFADGTEPSLWVKSRLIESKDWRAVAKVEFPIMVDIKNSKQCNHVYIRFRSTESFKMPTWINGKRQ